MADLSGLDITAIKTMLDRDAIFDLVRLERLWRDQCEWEKLDASYTDDGFVRVSWFEGSAHEFVRRSREMFNTGTLSKHLILPTLLRIEGDRALAESYGQVQIRGKLEGVEYDLVSHCRFLSRVARTRAGWRLGSFDAIYIRDNVTAVYPSERLPITADTVAKYRSSYRFISYLLGARYPVSQELPGDDRPDLVEKLYKEGEAWLHNRG